MTKQQELLNGLLNMIHITSRYIPNGELQPYYKYMQHIKYTLPRTTSDVELIRGNRYYYVEREKLYLVEYDYDRLRLIHCIYGPDILQEHGHRLTIQLPIIRRYFREDDIKQVLFSDLTLALEVYHARNSVGK